ncbi:DUF11 domain-containing protein [Psychrobacter jeotgali]|uniref:DUF11 domain-containing protein n=1 Tax=Psychrobacter jeotgali TaxID=179010 RepID=UPI001918DE35|nr:DUF11 domain-containing protein [Psychrobacter jeotgali]
MKPNPFKYSVLTVGIVTAMGVASIAMATTSLTYDQENAFSVTNKAEATYMVEGNTTEQKAESNEVKINVTETGAFSLIATSADDKPNDDLNKNLTINPQIDQKVDFKHTLSNAGNVADSYTISIQNGEGDDFNYSIANSVIKYQKVSADGNNIGDVVTVANGGTITLGAGESAGITVTAAAETARVVGKNGILTVTAISTFLNGKGKTATITNTDNAITTTPIYAINKSATTNLGTKNFDLKNDNAYVDYTITVTNQGNEDGTAVTIEDKLPNGLVAIQSGEDNYVAPTTTGGTSSVTPSISSDGRTVTVTGQNILQNQTITVTFRAKKAENATVDSTFNNYAVVRDDTNGDGSFDLVDSSGDKKDDSVIENNYEDPANPSVGTDTDNGTIRPTQQNRELNISKGADKEVALQSTNNVYTYTITNAGKDITEAAKAGDVLFTITPTTDISQINVTQVFVDANNNGVFDSGEKVLTANQSGQYDLNNAAPAGLASAVAGSPAGSVTIGVVVATNGSGSKLQGKNDIGKFEEITVAILPKTEVDGTPAPTKNVSTTSTTTMQGIDLTKYQAVASCGTAPTDIPANDWVTTDLTGTAGACAFYKLEAINTFTNIKINNIVLKDSLVGKLTYQSDFASDTSINSAAATSNISGNVITGTFASLAGKEIGNVYFSAKISQAGNNSNP